MQEANCKQAGSRLSAGMQGSTRCTRHVSAGLELSKIVSRADGSGALAGLYRSSPLLGGFGCPLRLVRFPVIVLAVWQCSCTPCSTLQRSSLQYATRRTCITQGGPACVEVLYEAAEELLLFELGQQPNIYLLHISSPQSKLRMFAAGCEGGSASLQTDDGMHDTFLGAFWLVLTCTCLTPG